MKKRLLSVLLALCMLLTMLPATAFAADSGTVETKVRVCYTNLPSTGEVSYWLYQEKVDTNGDVDSTITQTGASANYYNVKWEPATSTITLNNINASKVAVNTTGVSFIYLTQGDLNIKLLGANKIGDHEGANLIYAIYTTNADGTVTVSGPGSLLTRGGDYTSNTSHSGTPVRIAGNLIIQDGADFTTVCKYHKPQQHGIYVGGDLTIKDRAKLSATRTEIEHTYTREKCYALNLGGALTLENEGAIELKTFKPYKGKNTWWYVAWTCNKDITPGLDNYITAPDGLQLPSKQETGIYPRNNIDNVVQIYYSVKANAEPHTYDQEVAEGRYLATAANLTSPATYYRSCKCGAYEENKDNTFSYGDLACPVIFNTTNPECVRAMCSIPRRAVCLPPPMAPGAASITIPLRTPCILIISTPRTPRVLCTSATMILGIFRTPSRSMSPAIAPSRPNTEGMPSILGRILSLRGPVRLR